VKNLIFLVGILSINCSNDSLTKLSENDQSNSVDSIVSVPNEITKEVPIDSTFLSFLTDVQTVNANIRVELKYATDDNFMKIKLYERLVHAYLQKDVAIRLGKCQDYLTSLQPNLHLLVYDAVRPLSIQKKMWKALDTIPVKQRVKFVSNPANKSV
jgi:D-alanyl-D-alanine dipeptidase